MRLRGVSNRVARRIKAHETTVAMIAKEVFAEIVAVLESEEPVAIEGFGEFYFQYRDYDPKIACRPEVDPKEMGHIKYRRVAFRPIGYVRELLNRKCHSIGVRSSKASDLRAGGLAAAEIPKLREEVNKAQLDMRLKLRRMRGDTTMAEVATNLSFAIDEMTEE
jgi:nucleoid DNA-binding protein